MLIFRTFKTSIVAFFLMFSIFSASSSASPGTSKAFVGMGPLFSQGALGYLSGGADFHLARWENFSLSAGPWLGMFFSGHVIGTDLDGMLKAYYHIQFNGKFSLNVGAKLPLGLTLSSVSTPGLGSHFHPGFNIGLIPGVEFFFHHFIGIYAEMGFFHHSLFPPANNIASSHLPMGLFSVGAVFKF